jgi:dTDP-4-dehydrorhamnose 3,5-epimerase
MLDARPLEIADLIELTPRRFADERGFFSEVFNEARFAEAGIKARFVQDNVSL